MPGERLTEELVLSELGLKLGKNGHVTVLEQGSVESIALLDALLKKAGGKPDFCELSDMQTTGTGKAKPEFLITFDNKPDTIIVIECKKSGRNHESEKRSKPKNFAVDGVLYYAKFLKENYNVIAVAVSGTKKDSWKVSTFDWRKGQPLPVELPRGKDVLYSPENYLRLVSGEAIQKKISIVEIQELALNMHDKLRVLKVPERMKPVFIAGILIALNDKDFARDYTGLNSFNTLLNQLLRAIDNVLDNSDLKRKKEDIKSHFRMIGRNSEIKDIPLGYDNSLLWYISELDRKVKPMMDYADNTADALGIFYHEFVKYSGGDGSGLGIVLTPQHLTEFMCELSGLDKNSTVVDICCGSGAFLVTAMSHMFKGANVKEIERIRQRSLYGVELDDDIFTLAVANMIVRGDGKSNIYFGNCFNPDIVEELKEKNINIGLINPPYSQEDHCELEFVEQLLDILTVGGTGVAVVPMSCAIGTKFKEVRERLFKRHTLKAVFSMPDEIFYSKNVNTNVCVMIWEAHKTHNPKQNTFFGNFKEDGFVKVKKLGRVDKFSRWESIKNMWLELYRELDIKEGFTAKKEVNWNDEWLCEAYMETDYSKLSQEDFSMTVRKNLSYLVLSAKIDLIKPGKTPTHTPPLNVERWKSFKLSHLFAMERGTRLTKENRIDGDIPLATAGFANEGIAAHIANEEMKVYRDVLTIDMFCNCFYRGYEFVCDDNILILAPLFSGANRFNLLFLATIVSVNKHLYAYGRQYRQKDFREHVVRLPVDKNGNPDWQFMENYVKSLPYSDRI
ncbi:MAG: N-6 DNA methylase [Planctomycetaceae bacterium]|nr:N-6 DNA methylase [Planctomycetaceae bacterium]